MNFKKIQSIPILVLVCGQTAFAQPQDYQLGDTDFIPGSGTQYTPYLTDVEWGSIGKVNWESFSGNNPWALENAKETPAWPSFLDSNGVNPDEQPHGDVLAYTVGGVGDVDGDGYGDFAVTWYSTEIRDEQSAVPQSAGGPPGYFSGLQNQDPSMNRVGFVRVISGDPAYSLTWHEEDPTDIDTYNAVNANTLRRIGHDFWGKSEEGLWSHEITSIGDLDGDGRSEVIFSANSAGTGGGYLEIWAWTDQYYPFGAQGSDRWVKIIEITGADDLNDPPLPSVNSRTRMDEFGYNAYSGPVPDANSPVGDLDFNEDGQPDLIVSSRFYRDDQDGHFVYGNGGTGRNSAPGAVWVFLMPTSSVFDEIKAFAAQTCDIESNWTGESGPDGITDYLPLRMTSDDYTIKITGDQVLRSNNGVGPTSGYPRWFGNDIDPAGDLDGDGIMDIAVAAPYHVDQSRYIPGASFNDYEGVVYLFLSNSIRNNAGSRKWDYNNRPKYYLPSPPSAFSPVRQECGPKSFSYKIKENDFTLGDGQQVGMKSSDADYAMMGEPLSGSVGSFAFGSSFEAGMDFDGDGDPDMAVCNSRTGQAFVFLDLQSKILADIDNTLWGTQSSTRILWQYNSPNNIIESDIIIRSGGPLPNQVGTHFNLRDTGVNYARLGSLSVAGDQNGDGNCELFISCTASANRLLLVVNIPSDPTTVSSSDVVAEIWPEQINYNYIPNTRFNSIHAQHENLSGWALWNTPSQGQDDMLVGVRGFPRLVEEFSYMGAMYNIDYTELNIQDTNITKWLTVPAGKAYLLRSR